MNRLLTPLTNAVIGRKGTIDKYIGDAIMAFWNAPLDDAAQEANACEAALAHARGARAPQRGARRGGRGRRAALPACIGIGINTGPCFVGNMGSDLHFNYSVLGDTVNLAARLEGAVQGYGVPIMVGARTARRSSRLFSPRARPASGQGQDRARAHLHDRRPQG